MSKKKCSFTITFQLENSPEKLIDQIQSEIFRRMPNIHFEAKYVYRRKNYLLIFKTRTLEDMIVVNHIAHEYL